jgi:S1-C subfamily serine protease
MSQPEQSKPLQLSPCKICEADAQSGVSRSQPVACSAFNDDQVKRWPVAQNAQEKTWHSGEGGIADGLSAALDPHDAVVRVSVTESRFNYGQPWTTLAQSSCCGTAFACEWDGQRLLLTCAHVVRHAVLVELRKSNGHRKYAARVRCLGLECDLALLELVSTEHDDFWVDVPTLKLSRGLPELGDEVTCVGYPTGGVNLCITQGVVSRIDMQAYSPSARELLVVQIDAAINPGNSGGPVLDKDGSCMGIAFQALYDTENIGFIIPSHCVIDHFLENYFLHGKYTGFGDCGFSLLALENKHMRRKLGLAAEHKDGAMVHKIHKATPAASVLRKGDVLLSIDGNRVGQDGRVTFRSKARISVNFLATQKYAGDKCELVIIREGVEQHVELELSFMEWLVTMDPATPPEYFSIGGLIFTVLSEPFLRHRFTRGRQCAHYGSAPPRLTFHWETYARREFSGHQIVVLTDVLADVITQGLTSLSNRRLLSFNGQEIRNLKHLIDMVDNCSDEWLQFDLEGETPVALPVAEARAATPSILARNMMPSDRSVQHRSEKV